MTSRQRMLLWTSVAFCGWGMMRALDDVLVAARQAERPNHDAEAMIVHLSFFAAYFLLPIPISGVIRRAGYRWGISAATGLMGAGSLACALGLRLHLWPVALIAVFCIAAGIAVLQTAGNPAVVLLGPPETAAARLLAVQSAMPLGSFLAPLWVAAAHSNSRTLPGSLQSIYLFMGIALLALSLGFVLRREKVSRSPIAPRASMQESPMRASLVFAGLSIFLFVGTETTVLTHILAYRQAYTSRSAPLLWAAPLSIYWLMVLVGRVTSSLLTRRFDLVWILRISGLAGATLVAAALLLRNDAGTLALLLTGIFNAAIFPVVFSLTTRSLGPDAMSAASGWLMTAICGGAVLPLLSGLLADHDGLPAAFLLPILSYVWIAATAARCRTADSIPA